MDERSPLSNTSPIVDEWFQELDHPLKEEMLLVRYLILEADQRMSESIKWKAPTFEFKGNLVSFQPRAKKFVSLMFHRGSEIPGDHPVLQGDAALVRTMRLTDESDIANQREALQAVVRAWCDWKAG
ncbi:MAG: DUF1801 domain-containing protein [Chloroflexota bacterium]|nr:MAG: DUF1801 domain-containing protein [Chloroflexota bacterium]